MGEFETDQETFVSKLIFLLRSRSGTAYCSSPSFRLELEKLDNIFGIFQYNHSLPKVIKLLTIGLRTRKISYKSLLAAGLELEGDNPWDILAVKCFLSDIVSQRSKVKLKKDLIKAIDPYSKRPGLKELTISVLYSEIDR